MRPRVTISCYSTLHRPSVWITGSLFFFWDTCGSARYYWTFHLHRAIVTSIYISHRIHPAPSCRRRLLHTYSHKYRTHVYTSTPGGTAVNILSDARV
ncbi:hypothetical protein C8Q72DRAFT_176437 [Fomitopsis betulina]|nr:hypothetical protein C8Q72DRAFT_193825 [Fomitopsis betulina]KAI0716064.1 hypothetical protein C8Q72DRAFT_176437 [Fomitopsis betulina]